MRHRLAVLLKYATIAVVAMALVLLLVPGATKTNQSHLVKELSMNYTKNVNDLINIQLTIEKNNKTILRAEHDPITFNWMKATIETLLRPYIVTPNTKDFRANYKFTFEDGVTQSDVIDLEYGGCIPAPYIEVGTGTQANTPSVYKLAQLWMRKEVEHWSYTENASTIHIHYQSTFTASSATSISEVGLSIIVCGRYLLVSYYALSTPIQLNNTDSITVNYDIYIQKSLPFTDNFYRLLALYMLGYKDIGGVPNTATTTDGTSINGIDTGRDMYYDYGIRDRYAENIKFIYDPYGFSQVEPIHAYMIGDNAGAMTSPGYVYDNTLSLSTTNDSITVGFHVSFDFAQQTTVYGVALLYNVDISLGASLAPKPIMMAYFPLPSPVTVPANGGIGLYISFTIKGS